MKLGLIACFVVFEMGNVAGKDEFDLNENLKDQKEGLRKSLDSLKWDTYRYMTTDIRHEFEEHIKEQYSVLTRLRSKLNKVNENYLISAFSEEISHKSELIQNMLNRTLSEVNSGCVWQRAENFIDFYVRQSDVKDPSFLRTLSYTQSLLNSLDSLFTSNYYTFYYFCIIILLCILSLSIFLQTLIK